METLIAASDTASYVTGIVAPLLLLHGVFACLLRRPRRAVTAAITTLLLLACLTFPPVLLAAAGTLPRCDGLDWLSVAAQALVLLGFALAPAWSGKTQFGPYDFAIAWFAGMFLLILALALAELRTLAGLRAYMFMYLAALHAALLHAVAGLPFERPLAKLREDLGL